MLNKSAVTSGPAHNEAKRLVHKQLAPIEDQGEGVPACGSGPKIGFGLTESFVGCLVANALADNMSGHFFRGGDSSCAACLVRGKES